MISVAAGKSAFSRNTRNGGRVARPYSRPIVTCSEGDRDEPHPPLPRRTGRARRHLLTLAVAAPTALAIIPDPGGGPGSRPQPAIHTVVTGGMPGWQITLIAAGAALAAVRCRRGAPRPGLGDTAERYSWPGLGTAERYRAGQLTHEGPVDDTVDDEVQRAVRLLMILCGRVAPDCNPGRGRAWPPGTRTGGNGRQRSPIPGPAWRQSPGLPARPPAIRRAAPAAAAGKPDQALAPTVDVLPPRAWRKPYTVSNNCQTV